MQGRNSRVNVPTKPHGDRECRSLSGRGSAGPATEAQPAQHNAQRKAGTADKVLEALLTRVAYQ